MYTILFKHSADRALQRLPESLQKRIVAQVDELAHDPRPQGSVKLAGQVEMWRIRIGSYRVIYEIQDDRLIVLVLRVAHRKDVYRRI